MTKQDAIESRPRHESVRRLADRKARTRQFRAWLRRRRHRALSRTLEALPEPVRVLDVGGSPFFWETVEAAGRCEITLLNKEEARNARVFRQTTFRDYRLLIGDACAMPEIGDDSYDFVVCNSVIEHVGAWPQMRAAAAELQRVGRHGWVQIPAIECPVETHLMLPFVHWFNRSLQRRIVETCHRIPATEARELVEGLNLVSRKEMRMLFPEASVTTERLMLLPKSHLATW